MDRVSQGSNSDVYPLIFSFYPILIFIPQKMTTSRVSIMTDLWSVDQTKVSFMGLTAHWVESMQSGEWEIHDEVIVFYAIAGAHTGENPGRYFVRLCKQAGIITSNDSKVCKQVFSTLFDTNVPIQLFCVTTDNTSNNDTIYNYIESTLHSHRIYSFNLNQLCLPLPRTCCQPCHHCFYEHCHLNFPC